MKCVCGSDHAVRLVNIRDLQIEVALEATHIFSPEPTPRCRECRQKDPTNWRYDLVGNL